MVTPAVAAVFVGADSEILIAVAAPVVAAVAIDCRKPRRSRSQELQVVQSVLGGQIRSYAANFSTSLKRLELKTPSGGAWSVVEQACWVRVSLSGRPHSLLRPYVIPG